MSLAAFRRNHVGELVREIKAADRERRSDVAPRDDLKAMNRKGTARKRHIISIGERFDALTTVKAMLLHETRGVLWLCQCDCGGQAFRYTAILNQNARAGAVQRCAECTKAARADAKAAWRDMVGEAYRKQFVDYRTLWTPAQTERLVEGVREDLAAEFGDPVEWEPGLASFTAAAEWKETRPQKRSEREVALAEDEVSLYDPPMEITPELRSALSSLSEVA